jgi:hypothetical protein
LPSVEEILNEIGLGSYWDIFKEHEFTELDTLEDLNESHLEKMHIPMGKHGKLLRKAKEVVSLFVK